MQEESNRSTYDCTKTFENEVIANCSADGMPTRKMARRIVPSMRIPRQTMR